MQFVPISDPSVRPTLAWDFVALDHCQVPVEGGSTSGNTGSRTRIEPENPMRSGLGGT